MEASVIPTTGIIYVPTIDYKNTPIVKWSKLCIVHLNIQSLNSKVAYVNMLASIESPDVLCLSEHHLPQVQIEKINFIAPCFWPLTTAVCKIRVEVLVFLLPRSGVIMSAPVLTSWPKTVSFILKLV